MKFPLLIIAFILSYTTTIHSQKINQEVHIENQQPFLLGKITPEALSAKTYKTWYLPNFSNYKADTEKIKLIKEHLNAYKILIFMGTWCDDSKREVPRFLKILEQAEYPNENLKIIALDKRKEAYKKSPQGEEWGLNIRRVPTFIFYKNGREINRIIETPITSLEDDILKIVSQQVYLPNYGTSLHFD
ncbi:Thiol-disulfide isomerase or thioredoxin [Maribacter dokdonensis]|uniref:TlpA family protein disulfide reductase n=1 Tax=Maribacter dokdonensis TaxID=320912 RepID=UPI001B1DFE6D|nr:thioredoxin family protein [Maribacter dokdonensis]CAG2532063.1 Thiol-disulfide isomerase or thioredoxin [Maribacter dokdonensis]